MSEGRIGPVHEPHGASQTTGEGGLRGRLLPLGAGAAAIALVMFGMSRCSGENADIQQIVPVAKDATEFTVSGEEDGQRGAFVVLPGGTLVSPVGFEAVQKGVRVCVSRPIEIEQSTNLDTPTEFVPAKCARAIIVAPSSADPAAVELPGSPLDRGVTLHIATGAPDDGVIPVTVRATIDNGDKKAK